MAEPKIMPIFLMDTVWFISPLFTVSTKPCKASEEKLIPSFWNSHILHSV